MKGLARMMMMAMVVVATLCTFGVMSAPTHACDYGDNLQLNANYEVHDLAQALNDACALRDQHAYLDHRERLLAVSYNAQALRANRHHAIEQLQQLKRQQLRAAQLRARHAQQQLRLERRSHVQPLRNAARALTRGVCD